MKFLKPILSLSVALVFATVFGALFATFTKINVVVPIMAIMAATLFAAVIQQPTTTLRDGVYTEVWLGEWVQKFRFGRSWIDQIPRYDQYVKNKTIHLVDVGSDPQVFINMVIDKDNPVSVATRVDQDIPITLDKYDSENTLITLDELRAISYDKMAVTMNLHMNAIADKAAIRAAWRLAPTNPAQIFKTSGASDGRAVAKKMMTPDDLVMMSEVASKPSDEGGVDMPDDDGKRIAVLHYLHVADLQRKDQLFDKQWRNAQTGQLFDYNGWKIFKFNRNARYKDVAGTLTKNAFGAAIDGANDLHSSLFFHADRAFAAADASPEMFYRLATTDPQTRANTVGFQQYGIIGPKKTDSFYSVVSPKV